MGKRVICWSVLLIPTFTIHCGGSPASAPSHPPEAMSTPADTQRAGEALPPCQRPIGGPGEVWPRIEAARKLSDEALIEECGAPFVEEVSGWRPPPVDLLAKIVAASRAEGTLDSWVMKASETNSRLAEHIVGMDIVGGWHIGGDTAGIGENASRWATRHGDLEAVQRATAEANQLAELLPKVTAVHELRCRLEVNPLGFAVDCTPIHPAREKIDLTWNAKMRDGHLEDLHLTKCTSSRSCKKLQETAEQLKTLYLGLMQEVEALDVEIYREQLKAWLVLPPFQ